MGQPGKSLHRFFLKKLVRTFTLVKTLFTIACALVLLLQSSHLTVIYLLYLSRQQQITWNYCVNRLEPESLCYGKCYVANYITDLEDEQSDTLPAPNEEKRGGPFLPLQYPVLMPELGVTAGAPAPAYRRSPASAFPPGVFHPPCA